MAVDLQMCRAQVRFFKFSKELLCFAPMQTGSPDVQHRVIFETELGQRFLDAFGQRRPLPGRRNTEDLLKKVIWIQVHFPHEYAG